MRSRGDCCLIGACVFCGDLTVLIMKGDGLGERDGGGFEKEAG